MFKIFNILLLFMTFNTFVDARDIRFEINSIIKKAFAQEEDKTRIANMASTQQDVISKNSTPMRYLFIMI